MGEVNGHFDGGINGGMEEDERVYEWEAGLPNADDLPPLNQGLVPARLLSAFNIRPVPCRTAGDVSRASHDTLSMIRGRSPASNFTPIGETIAAGDEEIDAGGSDSKKFRRNDSLDDEDSSKTLKRHRLVWTPQLHKRFVEVVTHLGLKNAVPKTIMQLMNVEGLTRENVASHLQKYRLYLKRMHGSSSSFDAGPCNSSSNTEQLFASTPAPANLPENSNSTGNIMMPPPMIPMPYGQGHHMGMGSYSGFDSNHLHHHHHHHHQHHQQQQQQQYNQYGIGMMMMMQSGNKYGSVMPYYNHHQPSHVPHGDK